MADALTRRSWIQGEDPPAVKVHAAPVITSKLALLRRTTGTRSRRQDDDATGRLQ